MVSYQWGAKMLISELSDKLAVLSEPNYLIFHILVIEHDDANRILLAL